MSQAFVKEEDAEWLHDIAGTMPALINYLSRENNGIRVYLKKEYFSKTNQLIFEMSNGLKYAKDEMGKWQIVD